MKNYFDFTNGEIDEIKAGIERRVGQFGQSPFTYYINNVVSLQGHPKWIGSAISDLVYWHESLSKMRMDLDIVGYMLNEICYDGKYDEEEKTNIKIVEDMIKYIAHEKLQEKVKKGLYGRYLDL